MEKNLKRSLSLEEYMAPFFDGRAALHLQAQGPLVFVSTRENIEKIWPDIAIATPNAAYD